MYKIKTDYSGSTDAELVQVVNVGLAGMKLNLKFTFVNGELTATVTAAADFTAALTGLSAGTAISTDTKNNCREILLEKTSVLTNEINVQAKGVKELLMTTGFPLNKVPEHVTMGAVQNFKVTRSDEAAGSMYLSVDTPSYRDYGTVFAYWDPALGPTPADINHLWFHRHSNGHSLTIKKLKPGVTYPFASAYKGNDTDDLIWSDIITKMVGD